ncbi:MAG: O-antigen ligase family protein [Alphaproteobacteria bacterium]|nr:O-antigen ligase family protein [Alphaproteobacteria bacterium]
MQNDSTSPTIGKSLSYYFLMLTLVVVFFICSGMGIFPYNDESDPKFGEVLGARFLYNSMFLAILAALIFLYRQSLAALANYKLLTALIAVYFLSVAVSINAKESLLFSIRITLFVTYFAVIASVIKPQHLARFIVIFFAVFAFANLGYILAMPQNGLMGGIHSGAYRGLFSHKNQFGYFCAYGVIIFALAAVYSPRFSKLLLCGAIMMIFAFMMLKSNSSGALTAAIFGLLASFAILYSQKIGATVKAVWLFVICFVCVAIIPFFNMLMNAALAMLGRDPSLTNRSDLWALYMTEYIKSPFLGLGAKAYYFDEGIKGRIQSALNVDSYLSPHNGYLDILLQIGAVGLVIYLLIVGSIVCKGIAKIFYGGDFIQKLLVVTTIMHLSRGVVETNGSIQLSVYFAMIIMAYVVFANSKNSALNTSRP